MPVLDKSVQLEILNNVVAFENGRFISLNSLPVAQQFNLEYLLNKGYLDAKYEQQSFNTFDVYNEYRLVGATGITKNGQELRLKLMEEFERVEQTRRQTVALEGANKRATIALVSSGIAIFISLLSFLVAFLTYIK